MALTLCALGHVATTAELRAYVHGQESVVDIFQMSKGTVRCRRGLYACAHLNDDELDAHRFGRPVRSRASVPAAEAFRQALVCVEPAQLRQLIADVGATVLPFEAVRSIVSDRVAGVSTLR